MATHRLEGAYARGAKRNPDGTWLHYWVDHNLEYQERTTNDSVFFLGAITDSTRRVRLLDVGHFIIESK